MRPFPVVGGVRARGISCRTRSSPPPRRDVLVSFCGYWRTDCVVVEARRPGILVSPREPGKGGPGAFELQPGRAGPARARPGPSARLHGDDYIATRLRPRRARGDPRLWRFAALRMDRVHASASLLTKTHPVVRHVAPSRLTGRGPDPLGGGPEACLSTLPGAPGGASALCLPAHGCHWLPFGPRR